MVIIFNFRNLYNFFYENQDPARIVEYTAVIFNLEYQDVRLKCRTDSWKFRQQSPLRRLRVKGAQNMTNNIRRRDLNQTIAAQTSFESVKHVWLDNQNRQIRETSGGYKLFDNGDLIIKNLTYFQFGQFACITRKGNRIDSVSTFIYPVIIGTKNL